MSIWTKALPYVLWAGTMAAGGAWLHGRDAHEHAREERDRAMSAEIARLASAVEAMPPREAPRTVIDPATIDASARAAAARAPASPACAGDAPGAAPQAPARTATQVAALDDARRVLDGALERRHITPEDIVAMRADLAQTDAESAHELRRQVAVALNENRLAPADGQFGLP
jgi:hypothetical protein